MPSESATYSSRQWDNGSRIIIGDTISDILPLSTVAKLRLFEVSSVSVHYVKTSKASK